MKQDVSKILVTGGAGFIGSHIVDKLLANGYEVKIIDNLSTGSLENISHHQENKDFHIIKGDIQNIDLLKNCLKDQDVVFHEAAITSISYSVKNPIITNEVNVTGTLNLLQACLEADVKRFIFASSASVYGDKNIAPLNENMKLYPKSPYAVSKCTGEHYVKLFYGLYGIETICLRYFNVYGPRAGSNKGVISIFMNKLLKNERPIIYGDGEQTRDFINVEDIAFANLLALNSNRAIGEILNIGTGTPSSINKIVNQLQESMDKKNIHPIYLDPRPGDVKQGYCDITRARTCLNFEPKITLKNGIRQLYNKYIKKSRRS